MTGLSLWVTARDELACGTLASKPCSDPPAVGSGGVCPSLFPFVSVKEAGACVCSTLSSADGHTGA